MSTHTGKDIFTHGGTVRLTRLNKEAATDAAKIKQSSIVVSDCSDDDSSELKFIGSPELKPDDGLKSIKGFSSSGNVPAKWKAAGRQIQRVVTVTQAFNRPQTREEKVRRQLYGSKASLPVLPVPVAISLLILNILLPGMGTIVGGFTFLCCATTYDKPTRKGISEKVPGLICTNLFVGLAQLLTVTFLLVGWFWSISWGVMMVKLAKERRKEESDGIS